MCRRMACSGEPIRVEDVLLRPKRSPIGQSLHSLHRRQDPDALLLDRDRAGPGAPTLHPDLEVLRELGDETRFVVSEPLRDLPGASQEVPESSWGVVRPGHHDLQPFTPERAYAAV
jgi:hypothetical protein